MRDCRRTSWQGTLSVEQVIGWYTNMKRASLSGEEWQMRSVASFGLFSNNFAQTYSPPAIYSSQKWSWAHIGWTSRCAKGSWYNDHSHPSRPPKRAECDRVCTTCFTDDLFDNQTIGFTDNEGSWGKHFNLSVSIRTTIFNQINGANLLISWSSPLHSFTCLKRASWAPRRIVITSSNSWRHAAWCGTRHLI